MQVPQVRHFTIAEPSTQSLYLRAGDTNAPSSPAVVVNRTGRLINEGVYETTPPCRGFCFSVGLQSPSAARPAQAQQPSSWSGVVRTAAGQPVAGATVVLTGEARSVTVITRPDGSFSFANLAPGQYSLVVRQAQLPSTPAIPITLPGTSVHRDGDRSKHRSGGCAGCFGPDCLCRHRWRKALQRLRQLAASQRPRLQHSFCCSPPAP